MLFEYPNTNLHELNLDWILAKIKEWYEVKAAWESTKAEFEELKNFVHSFFDDLDVQKEIDNKLDSMFESGELDELLNRTTGSIVYSPINFAHMFGMSPNFGNSIGNNAFMGQAVILNSAVGYAAKSTKRTYQILNGAKYYFYLTSNNNDRNIIADRPSVLTIRFYAHDNITVVAEHKINITKSGVQTHAFELIWNDPLQDTHENGLEYTYFIELEYDCIITSELSPTFMVSNFRTSMTVPSSGQCQPLLPIVNKQLPTFVSNYTIADGSRFDYDGGIIRISAKFTCNNLSVALVQLASLKEAFITKGLNQFVRCRAFNVTQNKYHDLIMEVFGNQPWLSFGTNDNRPAVGDELIICECIPWITQPDMMLYDIEL